MSLYDTQAFVQKMKKDKELRATVQKIRGSEPL